MPRPWGSKAPTLPGTSEGCDPASRRVWDLHPVTLHRHIQEPGDALMVNAGLLTGVC